MPIKANARNSISPISARSILETFYSEKLYGLFNLSHKFVSDWPSGSLSAERDATSVAFKSRRQSSAEHTAFDEISTRIDGNRNQINKRVRFSDTALNRSYLSPHSTRHIYVPYLSLISPRTAWLKIPWRFYVRVWTRIRKENFSMFREVHSNIYRNLYSNDNSSSERQLDY